MRRKTEQYFIFFMLCSVIGWLYEVFLEVVVYRWGFSNRGVFFGPYCVIYGFGGLILLIALGKLKEKKWRIGKIPVTPVVVFLGIVLLTTAVELAGSYIMEWIKGEWFWDYRRFSFNFQGRIALNPSIRFGIGGMVILYIIWPLLEKGMNRLSGRQTDILTSVLAAILAVDIVATVIWRM